MFRIVFLSVLLAVIHCGCLDYTHSYEKVDYSDYFNDGENVAVFLSITPTNVNNKMFVYNPALLNQRYMPCSTFKIPNTIMGLDAKILKDENTKLGYDGTFYPQFEVWNHDLTLKQAFAASCVWYYTKMANSLDKTFVQNWLNRAHYGNCDISAWENDSHHVYWIESSLEISPKEQVNFLYNLFELKDPQFQPNPKDVDILKSCMKLDQDVGQGNILYGKTGTGRNQNTKHLEGWFVGFVEASYSQKIYFAVHCANPQKEISGLDVREWVTKLLKEKHKDFLSCES